MYITVAEEGRPSRTLASVAWIDPTRPAHAAAARVRDATGAVRMVDVDELGRPAGARDGAMAHLGKEIARALVEQDAGDPDQPAGWRGALQRAADLSRQDPGVLTIADEVHRAAGDLTTAAAIRAYAMSTMGVLHEGPGFWLLRGMLERAER